MTHFPKLLLLLLAVATFAIGCSDTKGQQAQYPQKNKPLKKSNLSLTLRIVTALTATLTLRSAVMGGKERYVRT